MSKSVHVVGKFIKSKDPNFKQWSKEMGKLCCGCAFCGSNCYLVCTKWRLKYPGKTPDHLFFVSSWPSDGEDLNRIIKKNLGIDEDEDEEY